MNTGYPPDNFGTNKKLENQIKALQAKVKCLECCDTITVTEGAPVTDGTTVGELRYDPTTNILYAWDGSAWLSIGDGTGIVGTTALSPPVSAPAGDDPTILLNSTTGVLYYWNGATWEIGFTAVVDAAQIKTIEVNLSSADIMGMFATPIVVIPGEGGKVASIIKVVGTYTYGGVVYANGGPVTLRTSSGTVITGTIFGQAQMISATSIVTATTALGAVGTAGLLMVSGGDTTVSNTANAFTLGNGTIKLFITYQMISV